jgi:hypothetical protein
LAVSRLFTFLGGVAIAIGVGAIAYAHLAVAPDLQRSVDVARRLTDDAARGVDALFETSEASDAVRGPAQEVTSRTIAVAQPTITMLDALAATLREIPGTGGGPVAGVRRLAERIVPVGRGDAPAPEADERSPLGQNVTKLRRAVDALTNDTRRLHQAALAMDGVARRHEVPSFQPTVAALGLRVGEIRAILAETNPARGMTFLADFIAGIYLIVGTALVLVGHAASRGRFASA